MANNVHVSRVDIDEYLRSLDEPQRTSLETVRTRILAALPDADECISYRLPAFRWGGKVLAGFGAFKSHSSYLPHSGSVFPALRHELHGFTFTTGALHFAHDKPLSQDLINRLIEVRFAQAFPERSGPR